VNAFLVVTAACRPKLREPIDLSQPPSLRQDADLSFVITGSAACVVVAVGGELDLLTAAHLESRLVGVAKRYRRPIVVDLARVTFVDCAGLSALLRARATIEQSGVRLTASVRVGAARLLLDACGADLDLTDGR
jgi:anti-anti-sigma factor